MKMSDRNFEALIRARLDLNNIDADINAISEKPVTLKNIKIDTTSIVSQIQGALSKQKFNVNLNTSKSAIAAGSDKVVKDTTVAYRELMNVTKQIGKLELNLGKLGSTTNANEIVTITNQLNTLKDRYVELRTQLKDGLTVGQNSMLSQQIANIEMEFERLDARLVDTKQKLVSVMSENVSNGAVTSSIASVVAQYEKLGTTGHSQLTVVKNDIAELKVLQESMKSATGNDLVSQYRQYEQILARVKNTLSTISAESKTFASKLQISTLDNRMSTWLSKNSRAARDFGADIQGLRNRLTELGASGKATTSQLSSIEKEFNRIKQEAIAAGKTGQTFGAIFKSSFGVISRYISGAMLIYRGIATIKEMYNNVLEVDTAMTGLYRVTNMTGEQYNQLYNNMTTSAQKYGATLKDIINLTTSWVKLGYDANTASELAGVTTTYQHVTDIDTETATKHLVTAYKGFQNELNTAYQGNVTKAISYVSDIFDKLNNEYAVTASDIGNAMQRSASALSMAGNTIQESTALATGMIEVIQNAEKAGTVLQTTSLRLRGMKGELEELGEEVDDDVKSLSNMQTHILNLTHGKVNIFQDSGDFKSTYQIIKEIAAVYNSLKDTERADLLETVAGKRNANGIAALINNWSQVEAAMQSATDAEGTAAAENKKFMDSMQGKINATTASWQALSNTIMSSDFLKGLIDSGNTFLSILNNITKTLRSLPVLIGTITAVLSARKNVGRIKLFILLNMPTVTIILFRYKKFRCYHY
jgi:TP901 family phage tail tape measure protein